MGVKIEDLERTDAIQTESAEMVKADFEEIGSLIENKSIPGRILEKILVRSPQNLDGTI